MSESLSFLPDEPFRTMVQDPCSLPGVAGYCERMRSQLSLERFQHTIRVAILADSIAHANRFTANEARQTALAAILHDAARELGAAALFELAPPESELERSHPLTVHGRAGRKLAEMWGVTDERVLASISGHVLGVSPDDRVGMAVYVADISEPGRDCNEDIRELAMTDLRSAYIRAIRSKVGYLRSRNKPVHPHTTRIHEAIASAP
jgi:predicted HD superfamily hydrolase involved in NAD metabolism